MPNEKLPHRNQGSAAREFKESVKSRKAHDKWYDQLNDQYRDYSIPDLKSYIIRTYYNTVSAQRSNSKTGTREQQECENLEKYLSERISLGK